MGLACTVRESMAIYGVVPEGLLTFLDSLYKEVAKATSGLWCIASRDIPPEKIFLPSKNTVSSTENVGFILGTFR